MSISMDKFASEGQFLRYDPFAVSATRAAIFTIQCRSCGFEPEDTIVAPRVCPKCHSKSWERYTRPGSILENAERDVC